MDAGLLLAIIYIMGLLNSTSLGLTRNIDIHRNNHIQTLPMPQRCLYKGPKSPWTQPGTVPQYCNCNFSILLIRMLCMAFIGWELQSNNSNHGNHQHRRSVAPPPRAGSKYPILEVSDPRKAMKTTVFWTRNLKPSALGPPGTGSWGSTQSNIL